jgi:aminoglycoside phosphotransferase (APT) family kinase protein
MPVLRTGPFLDAELRIGDFGVDGLPAWIDRHAADLRAAWSPGLLEGLRRVSTVAQDLLDEVARSCVVHSDLNPKNLLLDPASLAVTGVVDWEFAHGGHPFTDLGNLLRFERDPGFTAAVASAYVDRRGGTPAEALDLARAADLWALVDLAAREAAGRGNPVASRADRLLRAVAQAQDLHAQPEG